MVFPSDDDQGESIWEAGCCRLRRASRIGLRFHGSRASIASTVVASDSRLGKLSNWCKRRKSVQRLGQRLAAMMHGGGCCGRSDGSVGRPWHDAAAFARNWQLCGLLIDAGKQRLESRPDLAPVPRQSAYALRQSRLGSGSPS